MGTARFNDIKRQFPRKMKGLIRSSALDIEFSSIVFICHRLQKPDKHCVPRHFGTSMRKSAPVPRKASRLVYHLLLTP